MRRKFYLLAGFVIGYLVGTQASPKQRARVSGLVDQVMSDPRLGGAARPNDTQVDPLRRSA